MSGCFLFAGIVMVAIVVGIIGMYTKKDPDRFKEGSFDRRSPESPPSLPPTPINEAPVITSRMESTPPGEATPRPPTTTEAAPVPIPRPRAEFEKYMSVEEAKREAVRRYPELGLLNSKMNLEFIRLHNLYRRTRPDFFRTPTWPLQLAEEAAKEP
jgi:hypothetical protein